MKCPFCDADKPELISLFGSQLLFSQYRCRNCRTYFEGLREDRGDPDETTPQRQQPAQDEHACQSLAPAREENAWQSVGPSREEYSPERQQPAREGNARQGVGPAREEHPPQRQQPGREQSAVQSVGAAGEAAAGPRCESASLQRSFFSS